MMIKAALLLVLSAPFARAAEDQYASLKPLMGTWIVDRDCRGIKDRFTVIIKRLPKTVVANFQSLKTPPTDMGRADIVSTGEEDHYRVVTALPNNPILKALNVKSIGGSLTVSTEESDDDALPNNYVTASSKISALSSLVTIRLRDKYKKATFIFTADSPISKDSCRGSAAKQPAKK